jgi:uncharacterized protein (DUF58 family)
MNRRETTATGASTTRERLLRVAEKRLPALTRLRQAESLPIRLHRRRIYVLPTRYGLAFALMLFVMLMAALNYGNNPALLLTSLLGAALLTSVFRAVRNLDQVELHSVQVVHVHAGEAMNFTLNFSMPQRAHYSLCLSGTFGATPFDLLPQHENRISVELATERRGWLSPGRLQISTDYPFGLFRPWSYLNPQLRFLVYPQLEIHAPGFPLATRAEGQRAMRGADDEFANLRDYRYADAQRLIAWKASARHDRLLVREFDRRQGIELLFDWAQLPELAYEARISRLAAWVSKAALAGMRYELILPQQHLAPDRGEAHRHACLQALALMPGAHQ